MVDQPDEAVASARRVCVLLAHASMRRALAHASMRRARPLPYFSGWPRLKRPFWKRHFNDGTMAEHLVEVIKLLPPTKKTEPPPSLQGRSANHKDQPRPMEHQPHLASGVAWSSPVDVERELRSGAWNFANVSLGALQPQRQGRNPSARGGEPPGVPKTNVK